MLGSLTGHDHCLQYLFKFVILTSIIKFDGTQPLESIFKLIQDMLQRM